KLIFGVIIMEVIKKIKGVIPPVVTPFKDNGEIDFDAYKDNLEKWVDEGINGVLAFGSNGETVHLSDDEKLELITKSKEVLPADKLLIAGSGGLTAKETIELTNKSAKRGADIALVITPYFYSSNMNENELIEYYTEVAEKSKIPIMLYNVPKYTGIKIPLKVIEKLSKHDNIVGMKDSSGDISYLAQINYISDDSFIPLVGTANAFYPALTLGVKGGILALANIAAAQCVEVLDLYKENKLNEAYKLYAKLIPANKAVTAEFGIPGLKFAMDKLGYNGGAPRKPLLALDDNDKSKMTEILKNTDLL
ncbi:MAG: dihydrodipicolinate synthase family protein, partial [Bacillota bacterium]